ncbi:unnamed protein product [Mucor circinelloides]
MKDTIFEIKQSATRENITFHFQTNDQFDAIKDAIVRKFNNKRRLSTSSSVEGSSPIHLQHHIGGLPSPPVEEKKVIAILPSLKPSKQQEPSSSPPLLSSQEIREKIQYLKDEKHRLFQLIKQMMMEEESRKRKAKAEEQSLQQRQAPPLPPQSAPATPPAQQQPKKKVGGEHQQHQHQHLLSIAVIIINHRTFVLDPHRLPLDITLTILIRISKDLDSIHLSIITRYHDLLIQDEVNLAQL